MMKKMYRLKVGEKYCTLNKNFHREGVAIPDAPSREDADVFVHVNTANAIIRRTHELQKDVRHSLVFDFPKFQPLLFQGGIEHEEFQQEVAGD